MRNTLSRIGGAIRNAFNRITGRGARSASSASRGSGMSTSGS